MFDFCVKDMKKGDKYLSADNVILPYASIGCDSRRYYLYSAQKREGRWMTDIREHMF